MKRAIELARHGMNNNFGGPFGAVVVNNGKIVGEGYNEVTSRKDPTAHAEVIAIRNACKELGTFDLSGCVIFCSCEPCPMCLGAIYWARIDIIYYSANRQNAAKGGFDDEFIFAEFGTSPQQRKVKCFQLIPDQGTTLFTEWIHKPDRTSY
ncbi:MAG: nucleoside deaminase [Cytophagales bacterium]|nr:nucleoside deaminase [Cytophagales bacterium]